MTNNPFPDQSEFYEAAAQKLAQHLNCNVDLIHDCMVGLDTIWNTPAHLDVVKEVTHEYNKAARYAHLLHTTLSNFSPAQRSDLEIGGATTIYQLAHLTKLLEQGATDAKQWLEQNPRDRGRNPAAYEVAELIRRIFRRQRKAVTYGISGVTGDPSTDFCRAVEFALGASGIKAGWRGPATEAWERQLQIGNRHRRMLNNQRG